MHVRACAHTHTHENGNLHKGVNILPNKDFNKPYYGYFVKERTF